MRALLILMGLTAGCASMEAGDLYHDPSYRERELIQTSLMKPENALIPEEGSQRATTYYVFVANEVKVVTSLEVFLMDIKTGVVPFAETFEVVRTVKQSKEDTRLAETQRRGEREGIVESLRQAADSLRKFFQKG